ncbi:coiled-coil domain-containing protein 157-like [Liolophura sinensis]|uniref:coiled-coil domain-containing protein 157-like n=1 Tax=Liolophura sinensis TaxID=3198878 RepID=UPI0031588017
MAALLGRKFCMESLQTDVSDLQAAVNDVFSRVGPVRYPSWKYPDRMSCDLDVEELLDVHSYSAENTDEERQMSHVVLYELVIDRLVLLLQGMSKYLENLLLLGKSPAGVDPPSSTSVGLVVKRYWKRLVQVHALCTQLNSECRSKERKISDLQESVLNLSDESCSIQKDEGNRSTIGFGGLIPPSSAEIRSVIGSPISHDCCHKSSQTLETAFVPCESCFYVQKSLRESGDTIINMCQSQSLPSSLLKFKPHVEGNDWLTANEVSQWNSEQIKDLKRINKHLDQLFANAESLKSDLDKSNRKCEQLQEKVKNGEKEVKLEKETQHGMAVQFEAKLSSLKTEHSEALSIAQEEKSKLEETQEDMKSQLDKYKDELTDQKKLLEKMKETHCELEKELESARTGSVSIQTLQGQIISLTSQLDEVTSQLDVKNKDLAKEQGKNRSAAKHSQSLQSKQGSLLQRLEEMGQENEDLRSELSELEETKEGLEEALHATKKQLTDLTTKSKEDQLLITRLGEEKSKLQRSVEETEKCLQGLESKLEEAKEQQRLLVEFPDLNGPVNQNIQGSGDLVQDMENQIEANNLRIRVLEEQNEAFRNSVRKMLESRDNRRPPAQPVPLWKQSSLDTLREDPESHRGHTVQYKTAWAVPEGNQSSSSNHGGLKQKSMSRQTQNSTLPSNTENFLVGRSGRPSSGKSGSASVGVYKQLKNSGKMANTSSRNSGQEVPKSGRSDKSNKSSTYAPVDTFTCTLCDKVYSRQRDLDIHKSYCTG